MAAPHLRHRLGAGGDQLEACLVAAAAVAVHSWAVEEQLPLAARICHSPLVGVGSMMDLGHCHHHESATVSCRARLSRFAGIVPPRSDYHRIPHLRPLVGQLREFRPDLRLAEEGLCSTSTAAAA